MKNRTLAITSGLMVSGLCLLFALNLIPFLTNMPSNKLIDYNNVKGTSVKIQKGMYPLNFHQQNQLIHFVNMSTAYVNKNSTHVQEADVEEIEIFQFSGPTVRLKPLHYENEELVYQIEDARLKDTSKGKFKVLLNETYDH